MCVYQDHQGLGRIRQTLALVTFQNMRASCETEWLNEGHPAHVVAGWIGHSVKVQRASYAQITDGHFEAFNSRPRRRSKSGTDSGTDSAETLPNATERTCAAKRPTPNERVDDERFSTRNEIQTIPEVGLEPTREINPTGF